MLRVTLLRNLLLLSLATAVLLPTYLFLFVHPSYHDLLTREAETEAGRYAGYLVRSLGLENKLLSKVRLPENLAEEVEKVSRDTLIVKWRIFAANGEMIFSTVPAEVGSINTKDYFVNIVARGQTYSKIVKKDRKTADGAVSRRDVVETYVPFMVGPRFGGAIEVYTDITEGVERVKALTRQSVITTIIMTAGFLLAILAALYRAYVSLQQRDQAEQALKNANEDLESRVAERTRELSEANEQLTHEISERAMAQMALSEALEESRRDREKLDGILRSVADGLVVTDDGSHILHMNAAAEELLEVSLEKALGRPLGELGLHDDFVQQIEKSLAIPKGGAAFDFELPGGTEDQPRMFQARFSPLHTDDTELSGLVLLIHDVTREREVERMKSAFLGMAAHELNTPLASILGYSELLAGLETELELSDEQQKEYLLLIHNKSVALARLVDDLLDISRIESGRSLSLVCSKFSVNELLRDVIRDYQEQNGRHQFELHTPSEDVVIDADSDRLRQIFDNLVSNAIKYSPEGGLVRLTVAEHDNRCRVVIADQGIGMTEEQLEHVFDRFYRVDSSNTAVQGVGLGMSIVRHIVQAHKGEIKVASEHGQGTTVTIDLPLGCPIQEVRPERD